MAFFQEYNRQRFTDASQILIIIKTLNSILTKIRDWNALILTGSKIANKCFFIHLLH